MINTLNFDDVVTSCCHYVILLQTSELNNGETVNKFGGNIDWTNANHMEMNLSKIKVSYTRIQSRPLRSHEI